MENFKIPYVTTETLRTQRVEIYLNDLRERVKQLRQQHDQVINNSLIIIQEINKISSSLSLEQYNAKNNPNIKELIKEFEKAPSKEILKPNSLERQESGLMDKSIEVKKILQSFDKIKESHVLRESAMLLKRTKGSLDKIETYLNDIVKETNSITTSPKMSSSSFDEIQIDVQSKSNKLGRLDLMQFSSCSSSEASLRVFKSAEDAKESKEQIYQDIKSSISSDIGYQGDVDSEYDILTTKKKIKNMK